MGIRFWASRVAGFGYLFYRFQPGMAIEHFPAGMIMKAQRLIYSGHVQGVGFRYSVKQIAAGFDVTGRVRNLADGRVEMFLQGEAAELSAMQQAILKSHLKGFIKTVENYDVAVENGLRGFIIAQ